MKAERAPVLGQEHPLAGVRDVVAERETLAFADEMADFVPGLSQSLAGRRTFQSSRSLAELVDLFLERTDNFARAHFRRKTTGGVGGAGEAWGTRRTDAQSEIVEKNSPVITGVNSNNTVANIFTLGFDR